MTVIQCETVIEMAKIRKILVAMPGALVESKTDSYKYSSGYRLDTICQDHSGPAVEKGKESPDLTVLGLFIGLIMGVTEGTVIGLLAYIALRLTDQHLDTSPVFSGGYFPPLVIGLSLGVCSSILLFVKVMSEFGALSGYKIKTVSLPMP